MSRLNSRRFALSASGFQRERWTRRDAGVGEQALFESICIRPNFEAPPLAQLDLGLLAESMLFYQRVDVILNRLAVHQLIRAVGPQTLVDVAESGLLTFSYWNQTDAVFRDKGNAAGQRFVLGMAEFQFPIEQ